MQGSAEIKTGSCDRFSNDEARTRKTMWPSFARGDGGMAGYCMVAAELLVRVPDDPDEKKPAKPVFCWK